MAYTKNVWTDQQVERPRTYTVTKNQDNTITLQDAFGVATDLGTPVNATNMNHIEDGIAQCYTDFENMIKAIYPVGAIYIGMTETCPLASLFGTWTKITGGLTLQQADSNHAVGTEISAGLPNITGYIGRIDGGSEAYGAFHADGKAGKLENNDGDPDPKVYFDASKNYNPDGTYTTTLYGKSSTVQPPALAVNIWRRVA